MEPKPFQKPHPPIWFSANHPDALRRGVASPRRRLRAAAVGGALTSNGCAQQPELAGP
jgi:alkanesulfonate monooxygenase SsuD/methylene tetrahydromethanopterin reductase-like flavin-dependent oxidoreductase (luciferase family)